MVSVAERGANVAAELRSAGEQILVHLGIAVWPVAISPGGEASTASGS